MQNLVLTNLTFSCFYWRVYNITNNEFHNGSCINKSCELILRPNEIGKSTDIQYISIRCKIFIKRCKMYQNECREEIISEC